MERPKRKRLITVRLDSDEHAFLKKESHEAYRSLNKHCLAKMMAPLREVAKYLAEDAEAPHDLLGWAYDFLHTEDGRSEKS